MSSNASSEAALRIANFIVTELNYDGPITDLVGNAPARLTEAINSAALMELTVFVEDSFGVQIQDDEIVPRNFSTVADVVRLLRDKGALAAPPRVGDPQRERSHS
jgi:acyl carrier protein